MKLREALTRISKLGRALSRFLFLFLVTSLLLLAGLIKIASGPNPTFIMGYSPVIVGSPSMEPLYQVQGIVIIEKGSLDEVKVGDVIAYRCPAINNLLALHRVVAIDQQGLYTKGDNNDQVDWQLVNDNNYVGRRVFHTNAFTWFVKMSIWDGRFLYLLIPLIIFYLSLRKLLKIIIERLEARRESAGS